MDRQKLIEEIESLKLYRHTAYGDLQMDEFGEWVREDDVVDAIDAHNPWHPWPAEKPTQECVLQMHYVWRYGRFDYETAFYNKTTGLWYKCVDELDDPLDDVIWFAYLLPNPPKEG